MSDFKISEIARAAGKSQRTVQRWCAAGFVKGARCSRGGHWRIRAASRGAAIVEVKLAGRGFARERKGPVRTLGGAVVPAVYVRRVETLKQGLRKTQGQLFIAARILDTAPQEFLPDDFIRSPAMAGWWSVVFGWCMCASGELRAGVDGLARLFGLPRRTFYRRYGHALRVARLLALHHLTAGERQTPQRDYFENGQQVRVDEIDFADMDARNGWKEPE